MKNPCDRKAIAMEYDISLLPIEFTRVYTHNTCGGGLGSCALKSKAHKYDIKQYRYLIIYNTII